LYYYQAFGLAIRSELHLPELVGGRAGKYDVNILFSRLDGAGPFDRFSETTLRVTNGEAYFSYAGIGSFLIRSGQLILIDPAPGVDEGSLRLFLLGNVLGTLAFLRGFLVLHGSAVAIEGRGVAFLAHSGEGKSSMAAAFSHKYPLIADDVLVIRTDEAAPLICPAFPQLKLISETAASLGFDPKRYSPISPLEKKVTPQVPEGFSVEPHPLKRVFLLEKGEGIELLPISRPEAVISLLRYTYTLRSLKAGVNQRQHFQHSARLAREVPFRRLIRPHDLKSLPEIVRMVARDLEEES
jgi:hypothetical protein